MELDTGAAVSLINETTYKEIRRQSFVSPLQPAQSKLRTYTGHHVQVLGIIQIKARYESNELPLSIHVVKGGGPNLMGRDWISHFEVNLSEIHRVVPSSPVKNILEKY